MTIYDEVKKYLEIEPRARLRKNKNRALGNMIIQKYHINTSRETMVEIVGEILSLDRAWRKTLEENKHLRGSDYTSKNKLERIKQEELGYNVVK